mmetsp:Transcript_27233/g.55743  ORF Transcript_27233/g.55743 Transcript_27233/m.55743 type:complete len:294 (-) Transcript_27233:154-1035(-)
MYIVLPCALAPRSGFWFLRPDFLAYFFAEQVAFNFRDTRMDKQERIVPHAGSIQLWAKQLGRCTHTHTHNTDACESMEMHQHLKDFMADLLSIGIARVNFIGHSMGARALVSFLGANSHVFNAPENMQLGAVLLPNPETDLKAFLDASSAISSVAESVTVYADKGDNAIFWAEYANSVFPSPSCKGLPFSFSLGRSVSPLRRQNRAEVANDVETDGLDESDLLDVDVIDTSSVFSNVQKLRHSYFNVSRDILEDIHEVLVSRNRAAQRKARLVKREGNVYGWLQAPPFYVMGS